MTYRQAYLTASEQFTASPAAQQTPELDARVLLAHAAGLSSASLFARWSETLPEPVHLVYQECLRRRLLGEPVAWIVGVKEFWGRDFSVGPGVLVPRPDTECLVGAALEVGAGPRVIDVCTGSGCVGITLALELSSAVEVWAADISSDALRYARQNAARWPGPKSTARVVSSDLLENAPGPWNLVVSNPPYLTPHETADRKTDGWLEPELALNGGGNDGLDLIRRLAGQAQSRLAGGGWLLIEAADAQADAVAQILGTVGLKKTRTWCDLAGQRRVTGAQQA